ncbi:choice-of-anchor tandem repeat GloVer-containing protein [Ideonella sp. DXS29W]|uniref:Choice-of-anchor tandem repeat GloVer-containing protein n=1 Tax=Ideonella lacteola TaxID=2984193 RepID=A0ABU9BTI3_9BURK
MHTPRRRSVQIPTALGGLPWSKSSRWPPVEGTDGALWGTVFSGGLGGGNGYKSYVAIYRYERGGRLDTVYRFGQDGFMGCYPEAGLILASDGNFYGITAGGGRVFRLGLDGEYTVVHHFGVGQAGGVRSFPLVQGPDGALYGGCQSGGEQGVRTICRMTLDGGCADIHHFSGGGPRVGKWPVGSLVATADGRMYGTIDGPLEADAGSVFVLGKATV